MILIRKASEQFSNEILKHSTLYTSTEPCAMCSGAIFWAGISNIVFRCSASKLETIAHGGLAMKSSEIFKNGNRIIRIEGPYFEKDAVKIHEGFGGSPNKIQ